MTNVADLVRIDPSATVARSTIFEPADITGAERPIHVAAGCRIGPGAVIYGGTTLGEGVVIEEHTVVGKPEFGYAMGGVFPGAATRCIVGEGTVIRSGAVVYSGNTPLRHRRSTALGAAKARRRH